MYGSNSIHYVRHVSIQLIAFKERRQKEKLSPSAAFSSSSLASVYALLKSNDDAHFFHYRRLVSNILIEENVTFIFAATHGEVDMTRQAWVRHYCVSICECDFLIHRNE